MNQFFYERRGKEKIKGLMEEGIRSQALRKSKVVKSGVHLNLPKLAIVLLVILGLLSLSLR